MSSLNKATIIGRLGAAMAETQLLLNLPKSVVMDFECESNTAEAE